MTAQDHLYPALEALSERTGDAEAVVDLSFPARLDFYQLKQRVDCLAGAFHARGVEHGQRVLWLGQNSGRILEGLLACARLGAIFCPVNWRQSSRELEFVIDDLEPALVLWQETEIGDRIRALRQFDPHSWLRSDGDHSQYEALLDCGVPPPPTMGGADDGVLILYTAAFDGRPNGALLSQRAIMAQSRNFADVRQLDTTSRYLNVGPLFHVATLLETLATLFAGGLNIFIRRADAGEICRAIEQERCNGAFMLPPVMDEIIEYVKKQPADIKSLRALPYNAAWNALITVDDSPWGRAPYGYGQTETFGYTTYCCLAPTATGGMGLPAPGLEVCMLDEAGRELPAGEAGEIAVKGATVMLGYWRRDALNRLRRHHGWHRCNDIGRLEEDGSCTFIGPKTQMIRSGQENIYPAEVENCLRAHADVADAAVIGVPDSQWDQSVKAIVVLRDGAQCSGDQLIAHCRSRIASYKKPRYVLFADSLPKSGGAVDYDALNEQYGGGGYPGQAGRS